MASPLKVRRGGSVATNNADPALPLCEDVEIDTMTIDDLAAVYRLGETLFTSEMSPVLYRTWDPYEVTGLFQTDAETCLVARNEAEEVIGFILGTTIEKNTAWTYGYIIWLGVHPRWQRLRVADRLLLELEKRMIHDGVRMFMVDTSADNRGAIRFFQSMGFTTQAEHIYLWKTVRGTQEKRTERMHRKRTVSKDGRDSKDAKDSRDSKDSKEKETRKKDRHPKHKEIAHHDKEIIDHDKEIAHYDKEIIDHDKEIIDHDKEIAHYDKEIIDHDKEIVHYGKEIIEYDKELVDHDKELVDHDKDQEVILYPTVSKED